MFYFNRVSKKECVLLGWGSIIALTILLLPLSNAVAEAPESSTFVHKTGMNHQTPGWAERLKGQTIVENAIEGRAERSALVEMQHERMMQQMEKEMDDSNSGGFNTMSMMHQYGAGKGNYLLNSDPDIEPVSMNSGGK
ncbi:MAG: hypothetical protein ACE1ZW_06765, partial [Nitrospirales bacterium]